MAPGPAVGHGFLPQPGQCLEPAALFDLNSDGEDFLLLRRQILCSYEGSALRSLGWTDIAQSANLSMSTALRRNCGKKALSGRKLSPLWRTRFKELMSEMGLWQWFVATKTDGLVRFGKKALPRPFLSTDLQQKLWRAPPTQWHILLRRERAGQHKTSLVQAALFCASDHPPSSRKSSHRSARSKVFCSLISQFLKKTQGL